MCCVHWCKVKLVSPKVSKKYIPTPPRCYAPPRRKKASAGRVCAQQGHQAVGSWPNPWWLEVGMGCMFPIVAVIAIMGVVA